jgi:predicted transcriptional regulator
MLEAARLITPQGKTIELSPEIYNQVQEILARQPKRSTRTRIDRAIQDTYGKYAGDDSLTQALLVERTAERAREDKKVMRLNG